MSNRIYLDNAYLKEVEDEVIEVNNKYVILKNNLFYPNSGGQLHDEGKIIQDNNEYRVIYVSFFNNKISHQVDKEGLKKGKVKCILDWERRYKMMRMHTASHVLCSIFNKETGALITGNQLGLDKSRIDFNLKNFDREKIKEYFRIANNIIKKNLEVKTYYIAKEEALKDKSLFKLKNVFKKDLEKFRIVEIVGLDKQADGGTHVKTLKELGKLEFIKAENKGKNNRRVYFGLKP